MLALSFYFSQWSIFNCCYNRFNQWHSHGLQRRSNLLLKSGQKWRLQSLLLVCRKKRVFCKAQCVCVCVCVCVFVCVCVCLQPAKFLYETVLAHGMSVGQLKQAVLNDLAEKQVVNNVPLSRFVRFHRACWLHFCGLCTNSLLEYWRIFLREFCYVNKWAIFNYLLFTTKTTWTTYYISVFWHQYVVLL